MKTVEYHGAVFNIKGLSEYTGVPYTTLAWRLRQGWSAWEAVKGVRVHETVNEFMEASNFEQYENERTSDVYKIYARWCEKELFESVLDNKTFTKHMCNYGWGMKSIGGYNVFVAPRRI